MSYNRRVWTVHYTNEKDWGLRPIRLRARPGMMKPRGGIWASPLGCDFGWREWCKEGRLRFLKPYRVYLEVTLERALLVNQVEDLDKLLWTPLLPGVTTISQRPDWGAMKRRGIDVVYVTEAGERATRFSAFRDRYSGRGLYGWDCESLLILRERAVVRWRKRRPQP